MSLKGPLPIVRSAIIFIKSPSFLFSYTFASKQKPVGLVYIGIKKANKIKVNKYLFKSQKRSSIQRATVKKALDLILKAAK